MKKLFSTKMIQCIRNEQQCTLHNFCVKVKCGSGRNRFQPN
uniref:Uncharacterized protein n=1 Tax=Setaria viridis TaxID=4556 RepID=A0A4U6VPH0_SETVI|nr:hypothetical protein SEVIR_2G051000v2 [Setaria viridis]